MANKKKTPQAKPKKKSSNLGYAEPKKIARQKTLPGMADKAIKSLENKALNYAEVRDARIGLSKQEGELKKDLLALMKKHEKEEYHRGNINISVIHEKENVKVKVKHKDDDEELSFDEPGEEEDEVPEDEEINVTVEA